MKIDTTRINHIGTSRLHKNLIRSTLNTKPLVVACFSSILPMITPMKSSIFCKDTKIASA